MKSEKRARLVPGVITHFSPNTSLIVPRSLINLKTSSSFLLQSIMGSSLCAPLPSPSPILHCLSYFHLLHLHGSDSFPLRISSLCPSHLHRSILFTFLSPLCNGPTLLICNQLHGDDFTFSWTMKSIHWHLDTIRLLSRAGQLSVKGQPGPASISVFSTSGNPPVLWSLI